MTAKAIQYYLSTDVVDGSAATVSADNPGYWPSAGVVPEYAYQSLGHIWFNAATTSSALESEIVFRFGKVESSTREITLYTMPIDSELFDRLKDATTGAEESNLVIRLYRPQSPTSTFDTVQNAELRLRYLLDSNWRRARKGVTPAVPSTGDRSLDPNFGVFCTWDGFVTPPNAVECQVRYRIYYKRAVPRAT